MPDTEFSKTLDIDLENQDLGCQDQVLVLVSTKYLNQDMSWSWSQQDWWSRRTRSSARLLVLILKIKK